MNSVNCTSEMKYDLFCQSIEHIIVNQSVHAKNEPYYNVKLFTSNLSILIVT